MHFSKHYSVDEARALLPSIREWLAELDTLQSVLRAHENHVAALLKEGGDAGGEPVNQMIKTLAECQRILQEFRLRQIQIKDLRRGLLDFPALRQGREVFLCWEKDEDDIEFWHDLETGYGGRERL
ncbi:MAG TPA: DUF2203 domain-containing protein [Verrucomicrobiae bacterium]